MLPAQAPPAPPPALPTPPALEYHLRLDLTVTLTLLTGVLLSEAAKADLAAHDCRWCDPTTIDTSVRDTLKWDDTDAAGVSSDVLAYALVPGLVVGWDLWATRGAAGAAQKRAVDLGLCAEAAAIAQALDQTIKFAAGRQRPFVAVRTAADRARLSDPDDNLSFYSGHASLTFALASAAGTVASLRGYREAPWIWGSGLALASLTAYLRIAADKHYFTDVLVGAALGGAIGALTPWLHRTRARGAVAIDLAPQLAPGGLGLSVRLEH